MVLIVLQCQEVQSAWRRRYLFELWNAAWRCRTACVITDSSRCGFARLAVLHVRLNEIIPIHDFCWLPCEETGKVFREESKNVRNLPESSSKFSPCPPARLVQEEVSSKAISTFLQDPVAFSIFDRARWTTKTRAGRTGHVKTTRPSWSWNAACLWRRIWPSWGTRCACPTALVLVIESIILVVQLVEIVELFVEFVVLGQRCAKFCYFPSQLL